VSVSARLERSQIGAAFEPFYRDAIQRIERGALIATDRAATEGLADIRGAMQGASLGRLGNALGATSDLKRGVGVHRAGAEGFSASGTIFIRSRSDRTRGAITAYTQGADIRPVRGRWLWIPSDQIPRVSQRERLTPELWHRNGLDAKIGPLVLITGRNGFPLLIVKNVGVAATGAARSVKSLTKRGMPRKGQVATETVVAFTAIPATSRAARVDVPHVLGAVQRQMPNYLAEAMGAR
jgi:hypothetical protein